MKVLRLITVCGLAAAGPAAAQCENPVWQHRFTTAQTGLAGTTGIARRAVCLQAFDPDGAGPMPEELYAGGMFHSAGGVVSPLLAKWNGQAWSSVGGGLVGDGVAALGVHDFDGSGPEPAKLVVAGGITSAGGVPVFNIALWDGVGWSALGTPPQWYRMVAISSIDLDGPGPNPARLILGAEGMEDPPSGGFTLKPFVVWDGQSWVFPSSEYHTMHSLAVFDDDGPGPAPESVFIGQSDTPGILRWDQTSWTVPGGGLGNRSMPWMCTALRVVDEDGPGPGRPVLLAGGNFLTAGGQPATNIARWNGTVWSAMGTGFLDSDVTDILSVANPSEPTRPHIYAVGISRLARWDQASWRVFASYDALSVFPPYPCLGWYQGSVYAGGISPITGVPSFGIAQLSCECYANCDGTISSPRVTANDFTCFLNAFVGGSLYANCDESTATPMMTANDFVCFLNAVAAGCP